MAEAKEKKVEEKFTIILPFKDKNKKRIIVETTNEKIIEAFRKKFAQRKNGDDFYANDYCKYYENKIEIDVSFFAGNKRVKDVWRYNIIKNEGKYKLQELSESECPFCCSKYIDRNPTVINKNICLLIIESPHKDEYCRGSEFIPVAPAQGTTGENIEKYFCEIINANKELHEFFKDGMQLVICNPVQFQASLYELHNVCNSWEYSELKDKIWRRLFKYKDENTLFLTRIKKYKPQIIINACTYKLGITIENHIKKKYKENTYTYIRASKHPSMWGLPDFRITKK